MKKAKRIARIGAIIILLTLALHVSLLVHLYNVTWHYDESNTNTYTGSLSHVDYHVVYRAGRWSRPQPFYTLYCSDGKEFSMDGAAARDLMEQEERDALLALPEGETVTAVIADDSGKLIALENDEQVFISLDEFNQWLRRYRIFCYAFLAGFLAVLILSFEIYLSFPYFRQLWISLGKRRRKAIRKQERSRLKESQKENGS